MGSSIADGLPLRVALPALMAAAALSLVAGCAAGDPPAKERTVPLPPDTVDVSPLDNERLAVLRGRRERAVAIISLDNGAILSNFALPSSAVALAYAGPDKLIDLLDGNRGTIEVRSTGGALLNAAHVGSKILSVSGVDGNHAYALLGGSKRTIVRVDTGTGRLGQRIAAPEGSATLAAHAFGFSDTLLVSDPEGILHELVLGTPAWRELPATGISPVYSTSGNAVYVFQKFNGARAVSVVALPDRLQVRIFAVGLGVARMASLDDGTLAILERGQNVATVRFIECGSPLLAIRSVHKSSRFFGSGVPWQLLELATPDPLETDAPPPVGGPYAAGC